MTRWLGAENGIKSLKLKEILMAMLTHPSVGDDFKHWILPFCSWKRSTCLLIYVSTGLNISGVPIVCRFWQTAFWAYFLRLPRRVGDLSPIDHLPLMEEILHHLGCIKPCKQWDKLPINWCRISSWFLPSTVVQASGTFVTKDGTACIFFYQVSRVFPMSGVGYW